RLAVHGEIVFAAEPVVVNPGDVRHGGIDAQIVRLGRARLRCGALPVSCHDRPPAACLDPIRTEKGGSALASSLTQVGRRALPNAVMGSPGTGLWVALPPVLMNSCRHCKPGD